MVIGEISTRYFDFLVVAKTIEELEEEARRMWQRHCDVYQDADPEIIESLIEDMNVIYVEKLPCAFRDREEI
jgi:hypothetical protein